MLYHLLVDIYQMFVKFFNCLCTLFQPLCFLMSSFDKLQKMKSFNVNLTENEAELRSRIFFNSINSFFPHDFSSIIMKEFIFPLLILQCCYAMMSKWHNINGHFLKYNFLQAFDLLYASKEKIQIHLLAAHDLLQSIITMVINHQNSLIFFFKFAS